MSDDSTPGQAPPPCGRPDCPGFCAWRIVHPAPRETHTVILEGVPAFVCFKCGDTRISDPVRAQIEQLLDAHPLDRTLPFREWKD